ncbi:MAG: response regulator, partial [Cyanobacteria bacterium J06555_3]
MYSNRANFQPKTFTKKVLKILLVDDQKFVRQKLQQMLLPEDNLQIVGVANDGEAAISQVELHQPDLVLIDIEMPKMNGIEASKIISERFPNCKILILSSHEDREYVQKIIAAGADGYVLKTISPEDLVMAIQSVCRGYSHFGSQLLKKIQLADDVISTTATNNTSAQPLNLPQRLASRQADDFLPSVSKWLTWGGISVVGAIFLAIPAAAIFKYKTVVKTQAIARPVEKLNLVQAAVEGQVAQILVKEGQTVERGQEIAMIERSRFQTQKNQLESSITQLQLQIVQFNAQIAGLEARIVAETERNQSEIIAARSELAGSRRNYQDKNAEVSSQLEESQAQVRAVRATLNAAKAKYNRYKAVAEAGAIGKDRLAETELEVRQQEQELKAAQAKLRRSVSALNPSNSQVEVAEQRIEQAQKSGRATIAGLTREKEALIQQRIEIERQLGQDREELNQVERELTKTKITAPIAGTIFQLDINNQGQTLQPGQEIAQIIPQDFQIEMKAT